MGEFIRGFGFPGGADEADVGVGVALLQKLVDFREPLGAAMVDRPNNFLLDVGSHKIIDVDRVALADQLFDVGDDRGGAQVAGFGDVRQALALLVEFPGAVDGGADGAAGAIADPLVDRLGR